MNIHYDLVNQFPIQQKGFWFVVFCFVLFGVLFLFILFLFLFCFCLFVCLFHTPQKLKWVMLAHKDIKTFEKMRNPKWRLRLSTTVIGWTYYFAGSNFNFFKVTKTMLGVIHKGWDHKVFWLSYKGGGSWTKITKSFPVKIEFLFIWFAMGLTLIFMSKRGALKSKYSCAVHSDFYCFASADICQHGLLHVATCVAYTIYSLTDVQQWSLNALLMLRHFRASAQLMVHSYFHRCSLADVFQHRSMSPFIAERCHSDNDLASLIVHRKFRLSLVKPSYLGLA